MAQRHVLPRPRVTGVARRGEDILEGTEVVLLALRVHITHISSIHHENESMTILVEAGQRGGSGDRLRFAVLNIENHSNQGRSEFQ